MDDLQLCFVVKKLKRRQPNQLIEYDLIKMKPREKKTLNIAYTFKSRLPNPWTCFMSNIKIKLDAMQMENDI